MARFIKDTNQDAPHLIAKGVSNGGGMHYGYAPSLVQYQGMNYAFFCSTPPSGVGLDAISMVKSTDLIKWSTPSFILKVSNPDNEQNACDPSVVRYNRGDGDYFYMFYSGDPKTIGTAIFVARSKEIEGPYAKYTERDTWEVNAKDPKIIIEPIHSVVGGGDFRWYGAGEQMVIVREGKLFLWYIDDTAGFPEKNQGFRIYFTTSLDPVRWSKKNTIKTSIGLHSPEIRWDELKKRYVTVYIEDPHTPRAHLDGRTSSDGVNWSAPVTLIPTGDFPRYAHNSGLLGDVRGFLVEGPRAFVGFGAPEGLKASYKNRGMWGQWDVFSMTAPLDGLNPPPTGPVPESPGWDIVDFLANHYDD